MANKYIAQKDDSHSIEGSMAYIASKLNVTRQNVHNAYQTNTLCSGYKIKLFEQSSQIIGRALDVYTHILFGDKTKDELMNLINVKTIKTVENLTKGIDEIVYCKKKRKYTFVEDLPKFITSSFFDSFEFEDEKLSFLIKEFLSLKSELVETSKLPKYLQFYIVCKIAQGNLLKISCDYKNERLVIPVFKLTTNSINNSIKIEKISNVSITDIEVSNRDFLENLNNKK